MIRHALILQQRGCAVLPCRERSKLPATEHGCLDATHDPKRVEEWWRYNPNFNIGIATGKPSGFFALDIDGDEGEASLRKLEEAHGVLPPTVEVITGRGRQLYFNMPPTGDVRNSAGVVGPGLDIRGSGGFVVAPPSIHPTGRAYAWSVDAAAITATAPGWLLPAPKPNGAPNGHAVPDWAALLAAGVSEGARDETVTRIAGHLLRRYVTPHVVVELLQVWNAMKCRPPLPDRDVLRIVNSIAGKELRRRGR
jgi:hypothetical protein